MEADVRTDDEPGIRQEAGVNPLSVHPFVADTIFALSSGTLPSAIAVIRISGPQARAALIALAGAPEPNPRRATLRPLRDAAGELLDRALVLWMPGPATATGEDSVELHLHGGRAVVAAILSTLAGCAGCRGAMPGEFTRRAFLNGRMDLVEAEGLADLLAAETEAARRQALRAAEGGLSAYIERFRERMLLLSARSEAQLQYGDDEGDVDEDVQLLSDIAALREELAAILAMPPAERLRDGFKIVIAGPPNAGKSSLINILSGREVAIESPEPGTTRDLIEVPLTIAGMAAILIDSAGLRETGETIEQAGIARANRAIDTADMVIWLGDARSCPREPAIKIHSRADLPERSTLPEGADLAVSTVTGAGIDALRRRVVEDMRKLEPPSEAILMNARQRELIAECVDQLGLTLEAQWPELVCDGLRAALRAIDRITGRSDTEAILDTIFGRFCLGK